MKNQKNITICLLASFVAWTLLVSFADVQPIGPQSSYVGLATLNGFIRDLVGVNMTLYAITDWLGLIPIAIAFGFAVFGLAQWIKRKNILKVDRSILALGVFYIAVIAVYVFFEKIVVNFRPVLIDGYLEASYPSSTTMLVMFVMPTALMQFNSRIKKRFIKICVLVVIIIYTVFMVVCRLLSGVHWITDIIGGAFISTSLVSAYSFLTHISILFESRYAQ